MSTDKIFKMWWPLGLIQGLDKTGLVNTSPLRDFMSNYFGERGYEYKRKVSFLGVDAATGDTLRFNETLSDTDKINAAMTSSAIPTAFEAQKWNFDGQNVVGVDGGVAWGVDLASAIQRCQEVVDDDSKITVDAVMCDTKKMPAYPKDEKD